MSGAKHASTQAEQRLFSATLANLAQPMHGERLRGALAALVGAGLDRLPLPGAGQTLERWRRLAEVAACDLALAKLFEGHTDALAILAELGGPALPSGATCGMWAAESRGERLVFEAAAPRQCVLSGKKRWCSGAPYLSHALVTAWEGAGQRLALVCLEQPAVQVTAEGWQAVGMAASRSVDVVFSNAAAVPVGAAGGYLARPGFWQGGAGIAACWYGAGAAIAEALRARVAAHADPHAAAHLGLLDARLAAVRALLREAAAAIDREPASDAEQIAFRARIAVESALEELFTLCARSFGAAPLCQDGVLAQRFFDLQVFVRQSHAERDWQHLGELAARNAAGDWSL